MTYCIGVSLDEGMIFASDSRTHAGVDNFAKFCKMTVFEQPGEREVQKRCRFDEGDGYFTLLSHAWGEGTRQVFRQLPELRW